MRSKNLGKTIACCAGRGACSLLAYAVSLLMFWSQLIPPIAFAQEMNASQRAFQNHGGNALNQNPIPPGPATFDALGTLGSDVGSPGVATGGQSALGATSSPSFPGFAIPGFAPPVPPELLLLCLSCLGLTGRQSFYR